MWTKEEYRIEYISGIQREAETERKYEQEIFVEKMRDILVHDVKIISNIEWIFIQETQGNNKYKKMSLYAGSVEEFTNTINLLYCDFNTQLTKKVSKQFVVDKATQLVNFVDNTLKGYFDKAEFTSMEYAFAMQVKNAIIEDNCINKLQLFFVSTNELSERFPDNLELEAFTYLGKTFDVKIMIVGFDEIYRYQSSTFEKEEIVIKTKNYGFEGVSCIKADVGTLKYNAYMVVIPGKFLADIYNDYSQRLLEQNVRSFLTVRGKINKGIRLTILNNPSEFFVFNNGICATAKSISVVNTEQGQVITEFTELQIVNGGQTTASLAAVAIKDKASLDDIYVQMKLTVTPENDFDLVRKIATYANSQNAVKQSDLNSNHPYYVRMAEFSLKTITPLANNSTVSTKWFFEQMRGSYEQPMMKMTQSQRDKYASEYPKSQKFSKGDLAKWLNSAACKPFDVAWGPEVNLSRFQNALESDWDKNEAKYHENYFKRLVAKGILFKRIGEIISEEEWYINNKGHRDKLVPYTFSKLVYEVQKEKLRLDYMKIWDKQKVDPLLEQEIRKCARLVFDLLNDPNRPIANAAEYAKREVFWKVVSAAKYKLYDETQSILLNKNNEDVQDRMSLSGQKLSNLMSGLVDICNKGPKYWEALAEKALMQNEVNTIEHKLLVTAKKIAETGVQQGNENTKAIITLHRRLVKDGLAK